MRESDLKTCQAVLYCGEEWTESREMRGCQTHFNQKQLMVVYLLTTPMKYSLYLASSFSLSLFLSVFCPSIHSLNPSRLKLVLPIFYHLSISLSRWIYLPLRHINSKLNSFLFAHPISACHPLKCFYAVTAEYVLNESSLKVSVCVCGCVCVSDNSRHTHLHEAVQRTLKP